MIILHISSIKNDKYWLNERILKHTIQFKRQCDNSSQSFKTGNKHLLFARIKGCFKWIFSTEALILKINLNLTSGMYLFRRKSYNTSAKVATNQVNISTLKCSCVMDLGQQSWYAN